MTSRTIARFSRPLVTVLLIGAIAAGCGVTDRRATGPTNQTGSHVAARPVESRISSSLGVRTASSDRGLVVSVDHHASDIGAAVLRRGGNAIDAAVATAFALAVTYPRAGNIGGGGFMMVHMADGRSVMIDYREEAPAAASETMYLRSDGTVDPEKSVFGYLAPGVPGTVPGLERAHREFGTLPWDELVRPAVRLAADGFLVDDDTAESLAKIAGKLARFPASAEIFLHDDGTPLTVGERLVQSDLAWSLGEIARDGAAAIQRGALAARLAASVQAEGGILTRADLARYQPRVRPTIHGTYRGFDVIAPPLPSSGGIATLMMLNFLSRFDVSDHAPNSVESLHLLAEAMRYGFRDRAAWLGDSDFVDVPVDDLISPDHIRTWTERFDPQRATSSAAIAGDIELAREGTDTTHFSIVDADGNAVSNTYTINYSWGSAAVAAGTGILLNNEMDDFNLRPGYTNTRGRIGTPANIIEPGKRMLSSMTPLILARDGRVVLVAGSPGGRTIINTVLRIVTGWVDHGMTLREAVDAPRLHHQWFPDEIRLEEDRLPAATIAALEARGHRIDIKESQGDAHCIEWDAELRRYTGIADTRIDGAVGVAAAPVSALHP